MFRLSLFGLLMLVAAIALAIVSLKYASSTWQAIVGILYLLACFVAVIVAIFDHAARRAFAIGFCIGALGYGVLVVNGHKTMNGTLEIPVDLVESDWSYALPTTLMLRDMYRRISRSVWFDDATGKEVSAAESARYQAGVAAGNISGMRSLSSRALPSGSSFVITGHYWLALLFGYLGGHLAHFVHLRRRREHAAEAAARTA